LLAEVFESVVHAFLDQGMGLTRQANAALIGDSFQPRRNIDAVTMDIFLIDNDIAKIDADAELKALFAGRIGVASRHLFLDGDSTFESRLHGRELGQKSIARVFDNGSFMFGYPGVNDFGTRTAPSRIGAFLVGIHHPRIAGHVGSQDGPKSALDGVISHGLPRRLSYLGVILGKLGPMAIE
jgi:hypothetical protein